MGLLETLTMQQKEMTIFKKILQPFTKLKTLNNIKCFRQPASLHACMCARLKSRNMLEI